MTFHHRRTQDITMEGLTWRRAALGDFVPQCGPGQAPVAGLQKLKQNGAQFLTSLVENLGFNE